MCGAEAAAAASPRCHPNAGDRLMAASMAAYSPRIRQADETSAGAPPATSTHRARDRLPA